MRILIVATKAPWPPRDGGRLALWLTRQGLAASGHELALVAPDIGDAASDARSDPLRALCEVVRVPVQPRPWPLAGTTALLQRRAISIVRHHHPAVETAVADLLRRWRPEVLHVEQLQAWANSAPARVAGVPALLRMQNIESALWSQLASGRRAGPLLRFESVRVRHAEHQALGAADRVLALTDDDALGLRAIAGLPAGHRIQALPPPFPAELPSAPACSGAPAVVLAGSGGWRPNRDGTRWFLREVVAPLRRRLPHATVHVFGPDGLPGAGIELHAAPDDAREAFPTDAIAAIPLFTASGIRMRILEAWARGLPVVATRIAAAGLPVCDGEQLLLADSADDFVHAIVRLQTEAGLRQRLIAAGRAQLRRNHDPATLAAALATHYRQLLSGSG